MDESSSTLPSLQQKPSAGTNGEPSAKTHINICSRQINSAGGAILRRLKTKCQTAFLKAAGALSCISQGGKKGNTIWVFNQTLACCVASPGDFRLTVGRTNVLLSRL